MTLDDLLKLAQTPRRVLPFKVGTLSGFVRGLNAGEVEEAGRLADKFELRTNRLPLLALGLCEADGTPLCGDPEKHVEQFSGLPNMVVAAVVEKIEEASKLLPGESEELVGNSEGRTDGSGSASP